MGDVYSGRYLDVRRADTVITDKEKAKPKVIIIKGRMIRQNSGTAALFAVTNTQATAYNELGA